MIQLSVGMDHSFAGNVKVLCSSPTKRPATLPIKRSRFATSTPASLQWRGLFAFRAWKEREANRRPPPMSRRPVKGRRAKQP